MTYIIEPLYYGQRIDNILKKNVWLTFAFLNNALLLFYIGTYLILI